MGSAFLLHFDYLCRIKLKQSNMKILKTLIVLTAVAFLSGCSDYGKKTKSGPIEVYYKEGVTEEQAQHAANFLANIDKAQNENTKEKRSFQLIKANDTVCLRMVANKEKLAGVQATAFLAIGNMISDSIFSGKPVNVELTDDKFKTFKTYPYQKLDFEKLETEQQ